MRRTMSCGWRRRSSRELSTALQQESCHEWSAHRQATAFPTGMTTVVEGIIVPERTAATAPPRAIQKTRQSARRHPIHRAMSSVACPNASRRRGACRQQTSCRLSGRCQRPVVVAYPSLRRTPLATATPRQPGDGPEEKRGSRVCTADCCRWSARTGRKAATSRMT